VEDRTEKIIEVKNVKKIYRMGSEKIYAVDDVSFEILKGEFCCLLGTSGSGKSTLLNLMAGIEKLSSGQIFIKGKKIHRMNENSLARFRQRYLGFVFQSYNLMSSMTALENVEFPLVFKRIRGRKRKKMARDMLIKVGLESRMSHKPKEMSGGQQQRVGIARAFVARPEIVFADEPTGNLDTKTAMEVMNLIKSIAKDNNQTIVMVTHDRRLADFADRIIHILDGKIQSIEVTKDIKVVKGTDELEDMATIVVNEEDELHTNKESKEQLVNELVIHEEPQGLFEENESLKANENQSEELKAEVVQQTESEIAASNNQS
jgi:putative ABC transport system ATP-binding protein